MSLNPQTVLMAEDGTQSGPKVEGEAGMAHSGKISQRREGRRQCILDSTVRCIRRSGFRDASMVDIAREAKMSIGALYRYFPSKDAILEAIADRDLVDLRFKLVGSDELSSDGFLKAFEERFLAGL